MSNGCHSCEYCWKLGTRCRGSQWLCEKHDQLIHGNGKRCKSYTGKRHDRKTQSREDAEEIMIGMMEGTI